MSITIDEGCGAQRYFNQYDRGIKSPKKKMAYLLV